MSTVVRESGLVNRLGSATSPYLLQHATNPVDRWQWGADAFSEAKRRDIPVLISVGYVACHPDPARLRAAVDMVPSPREQAGQDR